MGGLLLAKNEPGLRCHTLVTVVRKQFSVADGKLKKQNPNQLKIGLFSPSFGSQT